MNQALGASGIMGTGIDIIENRRMQKMIDKWGATFKDRVFLAEEQSYCDGKASPHHHYAGRFAVKEAVSKAFGTGINAHIGWLDIEVTRDKSSGAPSVRFSERVKDLLGSWGVGEVFVSLSHSKEYAVAHALVVGGATS